MKTGPELAKNEFCTACCACLNTCSRGAISMLPDSCGFLYPNIDQKLCVDCGKCAATCQSNEKLTGLLPRSAYATVNLNENRLMNSASGGVFPAIADYIFAAGGVVAGASWKKKKRRLLCEHRLIKSPDELIGLQGSKYVQSYIGDTYQQVEALLKLGTPVLFTGTPCQVAGLKAFLGIEYENLITADVICHGVPNNQLFSDSIEYFEKRTEASVTNLKFRDKALGWGLSGTISYLKADGEKASAPYNGDKSAYYGLFLAGTIYRECCYGCRWASNSRISDFTMGDFWGIENTMPEILTKDQFNSAKGISCCLVNTTKGEEIMAELIRKCAVLVRKTTVEQIAENNRQLNAPSQNNRLKRKAVFSLYRSGGYGLIAVWYETKKKLGRIKRKICKRTKCESTWTETDI